MTQIEEKFITSLKERNVSNSTISLYLFQLHQFNDGAIENFKKFEDINNIMENLQKYKINTQKTKIISIIALLKVFPEEKDLLNKYSEIVGNINKVTNVTNKEKSESQEKNWVTREEINNLWSSFDEVVKTFITKKQISEKQYNILLQFVVLSLYTITSPRRNVDYMQMKVVKKMDKDLSNDFNYFDIQKKVFVFNLYKTAKTYKQQVEKVPEELYSVLKTFLRFKPTENNFLLVDYEGCHLKHVNSITLILNKVFHKKVGASLLRSVFLSDKYSGLQKQLDNLKSTAESMGTSTSAALGVYIKK